MGNTDSNAPSKRNSTNDNHNNDEDSLDYLTGFGNELSSECLPGALPVGRNNPRSVPYGLYTEQLSGTAFTAPRALNRRTWLYRIQPSVAQQPHEQEQQSEPAADTVRYFGHTAPHECVPQVTPLRWMPPPPNDNNEIKNKNFVDGCTLMCHGGSPPHTKAGLAIYHYECNASMTRYESFCNTDGELLLVPQQGPLELVTELGVLKVAPCDIAVLPRGVVFSVRFQEGETRRGYMLEVYGGDGFQLPERGPIGSNGLANARDFLHPTAACSDFDNPQDYRQTTPHHTITVKAQSRLFEKHSDHSPYNVVAWHGNYLPYKYDLNRFCGVNSVTYDHLDPSVYTVLTCPSAFAKGTALADFVIFPPRFLATDTNTFRPPWFHRNTMSEYMGLIHGQYDAKLQSSSGGFQPGGASLHNCMVPHGPDAQAYEKAVADPCDQATYLDKGLAFMFETYLPLNVAPSALRGVDRGSWYLDENYASSSWKGLTADHFTGWQALQENNNKKEQEENDKNKKEE